MKFNKLKEVMLWVDLTFIQSDTIFGNKYEEKNINKVKAMKSEIAEDPEIMHLLTTEIDKSRSYLDTEEKVKEYIDGVLVRNKYNTKNYDISVEKREVTPIASRGNGVVIGVNDVDDENQFVYYNNIKSLITPYLKAIYYLSNVNTGLMKALQNVRKEVVKINQLSKNQKVEINNLTTLNEKFKNQISDLDTFNNELEDEIDGVLKSFQEVKDDFKSSLNSFNEIIKIKDEYIFTLLDTVTKNNKLINLQEENIQHLKDNSNLEYIKYQDYIKEHQQSYTQIAENSKSVHIANEVLREWNNELTEEIKTQKFLIESHEVTITKLLEKLDVRSEVYLEKIENGILRDMKELRKEYNKNLSELNKVKERLELMKYGKFE